MKDIALIFPGQGAQKVGMGKELYEACPAARAVFDLADDVLGLALTKIIFEGPEDKLMSTAFCQPAIFTVSMAGLEAFKAGDKFKSLNVRYSAGLSLGEYGALCAAGSIPFADCLRLIQKRGALMEEAARANPGKMAAVIGMDQDKLREIVKDAGCEIANFNALDQTVITGMAPAVEKACQMIAAAGGKKIIPLDVSGAFHSSLMRPAAEKFALALKDVALSVSDIKVVANVDARPQMSSEAIRSNLPRQIYSPVQWVGTVRFLASQGVSDLVEIGPGRVLKGLVRKIDPALNVQNIQAPEDIAALAF